MHATRARDSVLGPSASTFITIVIIMFVMNSSPPLGFLGFRLGKLAQLHERLALTGEPVDARKAGILLLAAAKAERSQQAVGAMLGIDRTTMMRLATELEGAGLLVRERQPDDRRVLRLGASPKGRSLARRLHQRIAAAETELLAVLDAAERAALQRTLAKLFAAWISSADDAATAGEAEHG